MPLSRQNSRSSKDVGIILLSSIALREVQSALNNEQLTLEIERLKKDVSVLTLKGFIERGKERGALSLRGWGCPDGQ